MEIYWAVLEWIPRGLVTANECKSKLSEIKSWILTFEPVVMEFTICLMKSTVVVLLTIDNAIRKWTFAKVAIIYLEQLSSLRKSFWLRQYDTLHFLRAMQSPTIAMDKWMCENQWYVIQSQNPAIAAEEPPLRQRQIAKFKCVPLQSACIES